MQQANDYCRLATEGSEGSESRIHIMSLRPQTAMKDGLREMAAQHALEMQQLVLAFSACAAAPGGDAAIAHPVAIARPAADSSVVTPARRPPSPPPPCS